MAGAREIELKVEGMTCDRCEVTVGNALRRARDVKEVRALDWRRGRAVVVAGEGTTAADLFEALARTHYRAKIVGEIGPAGGPKAAAAGGEYDLVVLGAGSAAFAAAIRASELGARVALVEEGTIGGTCVNVGCVPSKTLIRAAEVFHRGAGSAFEGVPLKRGKIAWKEVIAQKEELVRRLRKAKYEDVLAAYPAAELVQGRGVLRDGRTVAVDGRELRARKVIVATGAWPWAPPIPGLQEAGYLTSNEALSLPERPGSMIVVGGAAVGLEIAQAFARLGVKVTVLEALPRIVPLEDEEVGPALAGYLRDEGIEVHSSVKILRVERTWKGTRVACDIAGEARTFEAEKLLVAAGRRPRTQGLGLEQAGVELGRTGEVVVDPHLRSSNPDVYAAGDAAGIPMFVYVAAASGKLAADNALSGKARALDLAAIPRVTFTDPAVASAGLTEAEARRKGIEVKVARLSMEHVPRALAARDTRGFIKLVADAKTRKLLGAHILAPEAGEMIQEATLAIQYGIGVDEIASTVHPYLTNAEGFKLAAQTFDKDVAMLSCCAA